jgi:hypothetical protein
MHPRALLRRRPSASLVVSFLSLFVALGGVGWAATQLPKDSVGNAQLQNGSVSNWKIANGAVGNFKLAFGAVGARKIENGAVGKSQINSGQVQTRVTGTCPAAGQAIGSISSAGATSCVTTAPKQFGTATSSPVTVGSGATPIVTETLPAGSPYLLFANANASVTGTTMTQWVKLSCTLSPGGSASGQTDTATVHVSSDPESVTIPIAVPAGSTQSNSTAFLACTESHATGAAPTVTVAATLNAIQTASNS